MAASARFFSWQLYGGFQEAERKVAGFFPDYVEIDEQLPSLFPLEPLTARFREQDKLSHRDFLGSLMGLRISREMIGDILVGNGFAVFFVLNQAVPPILNEMKKVVCRSLHIPGSTGIRSSPTSFGIFIRAWFIANDWMRLYPF